MHDKHKSEEYWDSSFETGKERLIAAFSGIDHNAKLIEMRNLSNETLQFLGETSMQEEHYLIIQAAKEVLAERGIEFHN